MSSSGDGYDLIKSRTRRTDNFEYSFMLPFMKSCKHFNKRKKEKMYIPGLGMTQT
jgi:hypothetical protein